MMSGLEMGRVLDNHPVTRDWFVMDIAAPATAQKCQPGQFLHIRPIPTYDPLLRRPLSIYDVLSARGIISLLYRVAGRGTSLLAKAQPEDNIDIMGPLGRGFTIPMENESIILVGGGVGVAPLMYLARVSLERRCRVKLLLGAANATQLGAAKRFERVGAQVKTASLDGSAGRHGLVTDLLEEENPSDYSRIYTCGPVPMMARVSAWAKTHDMWGEVSLEEHMACGVGACLGCACQLNALQPGYAKVCKDGPVFNIDAVELSPDQGGKEKCLE